METYTDKEARKLLAYYAPRLCSRIFPGLFTEKPATVLCKTPIEKDRYEITAFDSADPAGIYHTLGDIAEIQGLKSPLDVLRGEEEY
jgi:hypothetical protein